MDNNELTIFRKKFYKNLENFIKDNKVLEDGDLYNIMKQTINDLSISEETSKKIMFYLGTYAKEEGKYSTKEYLTYETNPKADHKLYADLETGLTYKVLMDNVKKFEQQYNVISRDIKIYNMQEYNKEFELVKYKYFKNLLYNSQNTSLKLVKKDNK